MSQADRFTSRIRLAVLACLFAGGPGAALVAATSVAGPAMAGEAASPQGIWYTDERESIIRVRPCVDHAENFCGMIVWLKEPVEKDGSPKVDKLNPDPSKRSHAMVGSEILLGMAEDGDHWKGHAYNPEDGKQYDITFKVKSEQGEPDTADLRGCVLRFLCKTSTFNRAGDVPGGDPTLAAGGSKKKVTKASARK